MCRTRSFAVVVLTSCLVFSAANAQEALVKPKLPTQWVSGFGFAAGNWRVDRHPRFLADVNGDGKDDIVGFGDRGVLVSLSTGFSFLAPSKWVGNFGYNAGGWRVDKHPRFMADVNGDGRDDVVGFGDRGVLVSRSVFNPRSPGFVFEQPSKWVGGFGYSAGGWRVDKHPRFMADVNGDGKDDVVGFGNSGVWVSLSTGTAFQAPSKWIGAFGYNAGGWRVAKHPRFMADVNGDDKDDVVGLGDKGYWVSLSTGSGFEAPSLWLDDPNEEKDWLRGKIPRFMADVDGDGKDDAVLYAYAGVLALLSSGSGFGWSSSQSNYGHATGWRNEKHPRFVSDVNGDGKDDVVGFGNLGVWVSLSAGSYFSPPALVVGNFGYKLDAGGWRVDKHPRFLADVDGDGKDDIVGFGEYGVWVSTPFEMEYPL
ncbi:MAG: VCBS repeat-containing protein [Rhodobacteraceae bacterium]|nr:VCBS repeat-containing protein [Paracoccaceae bacterium]